MVKSTCVQFICSEPVYVCICLYVERERVMQSKQKREARSKAGYPDSNIDSTSSQKNRIAMTSPIENGDCW